MPKGLLPNSLNILPADFFPETSDTLNAEFNHSLYPPYRGFPGSVNPSNAKATFVQSTMMLFENYLNPVCHVGIHWIALTEYYQMSTNLPGFQSFLASFASFCIDQISHQQLKA